MAPDSPRIASVAEAATVAELLDRFNREYDTPTPGRAVLTRRLERLLAGPDLVALLAGDPGQTQPQLYYFRELGAAAPR